MVIFFSAFTAVLYHLRLLQPVVWLCEIFHRTLGISGAETLYGASQIFVGIESALMGRPYLERMTRSEFLMLLTTGMCNVARARSGYTWPFSRAFSHTSLVISCRLPRRRSPLGW